MSINHTFSDSLSQKITMYLLSLTTPFSFPRQLQSGFPLHLSSGSATLWTVISPTRSMIWAHAYSKEILQKQFGGITPKQCVVSSSTIDVRGVLLWAPPRPGFVKFNVDGIAKGCPRLTRCGGVLQNEMGETSALFSGPCLPRRLLQLKF
ncbi:hypothetical protein ERO13_A13G137600v2 [Gossypium hirsutum]|nr:hypothetical protein ERO13_A13G137600v2 [Gossypium hirsutum]